MAILEINFFIVIFVCIELVFCHLNPNPILDYNIPKRNISHLDSEFELVFAQVIFRHGNRSFLNTYDTDPYKGIQFEAKIFFFDNPTNPYYDDPTDASYWPDGFGQLSNAGKQREYELGRYIRRRYNNFIGPNYSSQKVYVQSSDTDRTLMSAECVMAGLFPPEGNQVWKSGFDWQPVPVHIPFPLENDYLIYQSVPCPKDDIFDKYMESPEIQYMLDMHRGLIQFLRENSGANVQTVADVAGMYQALSIEDEFGLPLPDWANYALKSTNGTLEYFNSVYFSSWVRTTEMKKAKTGFLVRDILNRFKQKSMGTLNPDQLLWIYSGHDNTVTNILSAFNVYQLHTPPYGASIYLELYRRGSKYYVQISYRQTHSDNGLTKWIPNCGLMCPLDRFIELYRNIVPNKSETYESLCRM